MQALYRLVARVMNTELAVLITGESGTGKSLIARAIHDFSDRRTLPFVVAQAADLQGVDGPATLLSRARGGSIVFDEVADYDADTQARVVRMLDMLGDKAPRVMATSQTDLPARMESGQFRQDLYYRLGGVTLHVPSLRERVEDIPLLAEHFLAKGERDLGTIRRLSQGATDLIRAYSWPGNVRQLENTIRRLLVTASETDIARAEVEQVLGQQPSPEPLAGTGSGRQAFRLGRPPPEALLRPAWRPAAAPRRLPAHPARGGAAADRDRAGCHRRKSGEMRRPPGHQPQHAAQEDHRSGHPRDPSPQVDVDRPH
jgi:two-component system, NtrC family, nitrogen regulation response regulator GlnG